MKLKFFKPFLAAFAICAIAILAVSCGDDDDVDCGKLETQIGNLEEDYFEAYIAGECEDLEGFYDQLTSKYNQAKSCKAFKEYLESEEMTFAEFMDERETEYNDDVENCGAPA